MSDPRGGQDAMAETVRTHKDVERRKDAAYWFAVGQHYAIPGSEDLGQDFTEFATGQAIAYYIDKSVTFLGSIPDQWQQFLATRVPA